MTIEHKFESELKTELVIDVTNSYFELLKELKIKPLLSMYNNSNEWHQQLNYRKHLVNNILLSMTDAEIRELKLKLK